MYIYVLMSGLEGTYLSVFYAPGAVWAHCSIYGNCSKYINVVKLVCNLLNCIHKICI